MNKKELLTLLNKTMPQKKYITVQYLLDDFFELVEIHRATITSRQIRKNIALFKIDGCKDYLKMVIFRCSGHYMVKFL